MTPAPSIPTAIADGQIDPFDLQVDGNDVYWMDWLVPPPVGWTGSEDRLTTLMTVDSQGLAAPRILDHGEHQGSSANPSLIAMDAEFIFWADTWGRFHQVDRLTEAATDVVSGQRVQAVVVDATHVYWSTQGGELFRRDRTSGASSQLATGLGTIGASLAVDSTHIYWISKGGFAEDALMSLDKNGGTPSVVVDSLPIGQFTLDASDIYFSDQDTLYRVDKTGGLATVVAADVRPLSELALDGTHVYWGDLDPGNDGVALVRMDKATGAIAPLASGLTAVTDLALDQNSVYWTDRDSGVVMRLAK